MSELTNLRREYHRQICQDIVRVHDGAPNLADVGNKASCEIGLKFVEALGWKPGHQGKLSGQTSGRLFELKTKEFIERAFGLLSHLRPGQWIYQVGVSIAHFYQYEHLAQLEKFLKEYPELLSTLGTEYIITPDIIIARSPEQDTAINEKCPLVDKDVARGTPLRRVNNEKLILHASISCKWTLRSDRSQNARSEALNLIRQRKGHTPHIMVVVAEPLPTRIASLALGTGDVDCVYHLGLPELREAIQALGYSDQLDMLNVLVEGRRLRDISDLPLDLVL